MHVVFNRAPYANTIVQHDGEEIIFNFSFFESKTGKNFGKEDDQDLRHPFDEINDYWSRLPIKEQKKIFDIYVEIRKVLDDDISYTSTRHSHIMTIQSKITDLVTQLMNHHSYSSIEHELSFHRGIIIPNDICIEFDPSNGDIIGTREQTYIREDYRQLIILSIALRPIGVFIGEYISYIENEVGVIWKEYNAFMTMSKSWIIQSEPFKRFELYVNANTDAKMNANSSNGENYATIIVSGLSLEDYPIWLIAMCIFKRIMFADITYQGEGKKNIIQNLYCFLQSKITNPVNSFKERIKQKHYDNDTSSGEEGKLSLLEHYKAKMEIPLGEIALIQHFFNDSLKLIRKIEPDIDVNLVQDMFDSSDLLLDKKLSDCQIILMQWILASTIPIRIIPYLEKSFIVRALGATAAILWHNGFYSLAGLITAHPVDSKSRIIYVGNESSRVPNELTEKMESYYPYSRRPSNRSPKKRPNSGTTAMNNMAQGFFNNDWYLTLKEDYLKIIQNVKQNNYYSAPSDLKIVLTKLIIAINERMKNESPISTQFD